MSNPLEDWRGRGSSFGRSHSDPFDDHNVDLRDRRLSSIQERPSDASTVSVPADVNEIDLQSGENSGDWPLNGEDAEQYMQEASDRHSLWCDIRAKFREPLAECLAVSFHPTHLFPLVR